MLVVLMACCVPMAIATQPERLAPGQVLRGRFVQERTMEGFAAPLKSTGDFVLAPDRGLIWQAKQPFAVTTVMTEKGILQENGDAQMLNLPSEKAPFVTQLYDILNGALVGDSALLEKHFAVRQSEDSAGWHILLTPRQGAQKAGIREIVIDGGQFVNHVQVTKDGGDRDRLIFTEQSLGAPLDSAEIDLLARVGEQ
jgi:hypothetical protein